MKIACSHKGSLKDFQLAVLDRIDELSEVETATEVGAALDTDSFASKFAKAIEDQIATLEDANSATNTANIPAAPAVSCEGDICGAEDALIENSYMQEVTERVIEKLLNNEKILDVDSYLEGTSVILLVSFLDKDGIIRYSVPNSDFSGDFGHDVNYIVDTILADIDR